jgi:sodium transport system permease protein
MDSKKIITIWKKELKDTVRDRRTLLSMVLIPILLMPVIMIGMFKLMESQQKSQAEQTVKVAIVNEGAAPQIVGKLTGTGKVDVVPVAGDPETSVAEENIDAAIIIPADFREKIANEQPAEITLIAKSTNLNSLNVSSALALAVAEYNSEILSTRFQEQGIDPKVLSDVTVVNRDAATAKETGGYILGFLIPLFIVIYSIAGGQYTAIDVSAGEKERKTLEALFLTPARRIEIVLGKFLAVATVALTSIVLAIGSLYVTFVYAGDAGMLSSADMNTGAASANIIGELSFTVEPQAAILLFAVSVFLVLMFSAFLLSISIFAKSFKEAESYISPAYLVVILPIVFVNSVPTFEPMLWHYAIPAVNAVLLFKEVLMGIYDTTHILVTFISLIIGSAAAILIATKIYSREKVLFGS